MDKTIVMIVTAAIIVIGGGVAVVIDKMNEPTGPGSGDVIEYSEGPGSGDVIDNPEGPGSGDVMDYPEGPGSGDVIDNPEGPGSGDVIDYPQGPGSGDEYPEGPGSGDEISIREALAKKIKGSCNAIGAASTCIDYIGSYFSNWTNIQLHCSDSRGTPSKNACPISVLGGCRTGIDTTNEQIIWAYNTGAESYTPENIGYFRRACVIPPGTAWVDG